MVHAAPGVSVTLDTATVHTPVHTKQQPVFIRSLFSPFCHPWQQSASFSVPSTVLCCTVPSWDCTVPTCTVLGTVLYQTVQ